MPDFLVTAERVTIHPHPATDAVELAQIGLIRAAVPAGAYRTGDVAVYLPEGSVLPPRLIDELGIGDRLAGPDRNRVKAIRVHGQLSQGVVCRPAALNGVDLATAAEQRRDLATLLGVTKWTPPVPPRLAGTAEPAPDLLPWPEIANLCRYPGVFIEDEPVVVTEKIHGTACLVSYLARTGAAHVSSKGFGARRTAIRPSDTNLHWRAVRTFNVIDFAAEVARRSGATRVGVFGEVYGRGVQDLGYGTDASQRPASRCWTSRSTRAGRCAGSTRPRCSRPATAGCRWHPCSTPARTTCRCCSPWPTGWRPSPDTPCTCAKVWWCGPTWNGRTR